MSHFHTVTLLFLLTENILLQFIAGLIFSYQPPVVQYLMAGGTTLFCAPRRYSSGCKNLGFNINFSLVSHNFMDLMCGSFEFFLSAFSAVMLADETKIPNHYSHIIVRWQSNVTLCQFNSTQMQLF